MAPQRKGILPGLAGLPGVLDMCYDAIDVIWVMNAPPAPTLHVFQRRAGIVIPTLVVPKDPAIALSHPGELRDAIGQ